jgi:hypothetical protein
MTEPPARHRVTSPRTPGGLPRRRSVASEIDAQSRLGEIYIGSLIRTQLRLALGTVVVLAATVGMLPLLFRLVPASRRLHVIGIPLPWVLLGAVVYPFLITLAWIYVRRAERNEQTFRDLLDRA